MINWIYSELPLSRNIKKVSLLLCFFLCMGCGYYEAPASGSSHVDHHLWNKLLAKHVSKSGEVNYKSFLKDRGQLQQYLSTLSHHAPDPETWTREQQLAYWINAYNAFTVELILDNYPLKSITELHPKLYVPGINTVWHKKFFEIGGEPISLDIIEHKILRKKFDEPRIHFAIVCASFSCPRLRNEAYTPEKLESQLEDQAIDFINDNRKNEISSEKLKISKIFSWFKGDFTKKGSLINFLNRYSKVTIDEDADVSYLKYDWGLNCQ
ncbi:DUF547 domain-containing protein [Fulvivirgaceae bacterium BMA10]|uniref:DUF547 domain-containing protein n=1 Tax=Splendidivirga corallicola TaxID=3051826 RepID=A0ABT8KQN4_9BACT|nr:DUF547 domain-containing protein [Fulvivirgaceae bacterium BMA10]